MPTRKISPNFNLKNSSNDMALSEVRDNVDNIMKWAQLVNQKIALLERAAHDMESSLFQVVASLEAAARSLIEKGIVDQDEFDGFRDEHIAKLEKLRQQYAQQAEDVASQLWVPNKKIIAP